jgi:hypothetical protein
MNLFKSFDSGLGQYMSKAAHPSGSMESSNPRRWRGKRLHHHGGDVRCVFVHGQLGISLTFPPFMYGVKTWSHTRAAHVRSTDGNCMIFFLS